MFKTHSNAYTSYNELSHILCHALLAKHGVITFLSNNLEDKRYKVLQEKVPQKQRRSSGVSEVAEEDVKPEEIKLEVKDCIQVGLNENRDKTAALSADINDCNNKESAISASIDSEKVDIHQLQPAKSG